jgi:hypothetical protein
MYIEPDRLLFLGDCLYEAPAGGYTSEEVFPLIKTVRAFGAELFVEGHSETVLAPTELEEILGEASRTAAR